MTFILQLSVTTQLGRLFIAGASGLAGVIFCFVNTHAPWARSSLILLGHSASLCCGFLISLGTTEAHCILEDAGPFRDFLLVGRKGTGSGYGAQGALILGSLPHPSNFWDFRHLLPGEVGVGVM